tara:strand:+ start:282 stop:467 length:186 start_codon:yes stop_codon:yes gene_type:complete
MEYNILNITLVGSFAFLTVALGIKWLGEALIEYRLAKLGLLMSKMNPKDLQQLVEEDEDER